MIARIDENKVLVDFDIKWSDGQDNLFYVCTDRQGSITALLNKMEL